MQQMTTALPVLAALPPAAAPLPPSAGRGPAAATQTAPTASAGATADEGADALAPAAAKDGSFAAVLARSLAKDGGNAKAPIGTVPVQLAADAASLPADPKEVKTDDKTGSADGAAAGIASLLPLLQPLQPGSPPPKPGAKPEAKLEARAEAKIDSGRLAASAGLPAVANSAPALPVAAEPMPTDGASGGLAAGDKRAEGRAAPLSLLADATGAPGKGAAAIPAAAPPALDAAASHGKSPDVPDASFANALASAQTPVQAHANRVPLAVEAPVGSAKWDSNVGEKLVWMVGHQEQRADLTLNPPQMGKVEVSISVNGDQANAQFVSANPAVRDALEAAMPRLREMLADAGINLGQAQVGSDSAQHAAGNSPNQRENGDNPQRGSRESGPSAAAVGVTWLRQGSGMVDVFA